MLPLDAGGARHLVDRSRGEVQGGAFPDFASLSPKAQPAECLVCLAVDPTDLRLVPVPANSGACFVLSAKDLIDSRAQASERLDPLNSSRKPAGNWLRWQEPVLRVVILPTERCDPPLTLVLPELERL